MGKRFNFDGLDGITSFRGRDLFGNHLFDGAGEGGGGEGGGSGGGGTEGGGGGQGGGSGSGEKTFTQAEVNAMMAREKDQGARSAAEQLAKDLGTSVEEAKAIIKEHHDRVEGEKSEAQKARDAADKEKAEAEKAKSEAAQERHEAKVERLLLRAGLDPGDEDKRLTRAMRMIDIEVGAEDTVVQAAVDDIKKDEPGWFGEGVKSKPKNSDPKGTPPKPKVDEDGYSRGQARAKQMAGPAQYDLLKTT